MNLGIFKMHFLTMYHRLVEFCNNNFHLSKIKHQSILLREIHHICVICCKYARIISTNHILLEKSALSFRKYIQLYWNNSIEIDFQLKYFPEKEIACT